MFMKGPPFNVPTSAPLGATNMPKQIKRNTEKMISHESEYGKSFTI